MILFGKLEDTVAASRRVNLGRTRDGSPGR